MDMTSRQVSSFTPEQRAEFAETYLSGLGGESPVRSCPVIDCWYIDSPGASSAQLVEHAAISAIHAMVEDA
jgi:hypothetical protein